MPRSSLSIIVALGLALAVSACNRGGWNLAKFKGTNEQLFTATLREYNRKKWDNAIGGFERLTTQLPARDTLLPRSHFLLAKAHSKRGEHLLATQGYSRIVESFPDDSLADESLFEMGREYQRMWKKPELDAAYGQSAINTYRTFTALYPTSPYVEEANRQVARLEEWLARKDYENAMLYLRRKAFDSAIIYFKDIIRIYPLTPTARRANLALLEAYRAIKWRDDAAELCVAMRQNYADDREVRAACGPGPVAAPVPVAVP